MLNCPTIAIGFWTVYISEQGGLYQISSGRARGDYDIVYFLDKTTITNCLDVH